MNKKSSRTFTERETLYLDVNTSCNAEENVSKI